MLLTFPADVLLVIFAIVIIFVVGFLAILGILNAKHGNKVRDEPEEISGSDPDLPS